MRDDRSASSPGTAARFGTAATPGIRAPRARSFDALARRPDDVESAAMNRRILASALLLLLFVSSWPALAHSGKSGTSRRARSGQARPPISLVWHVESLDGDVVESFQGDLPINPASVVKVATTWWALERLGPDHRFETRFRSRGALDPARERLRGDLVVEGTGDPDFQVENAFLVAGALNRKGVTSITGRLLVSDRFWMGWEDGSQGRQPDPGLRASLMGERLRQALDPQRWSRATRSAWLRFAQRRGLDPVRPPRVTVAGASRPTTPSDGDPLLLVHRSKPIAEVLRRFNCFSNNDIERVASVLGPASELGRIIADRTGAPPDAVRLETASGLGENRLSPRVAVRMLREFRRTSERLGLGVEWLLPVAGCDPGTVTRFYPTLSEGNYATSLVGKTGTLTSTDGGISVLAGFVNTARGEYVFCVAAPAAAGRLRAARHAEEKWLLDLVARGGGPRPRICAPPLEGPDADADVILAGAPRPPAGSASLAGRAGP